MRRYQLVFGLILLANAAAAQQQPDPAMMQNIATALQAQRNRALDEAAGAEAQVAKLQQDLAAVTKERDDLKGKLGADEKK